MRFTEGWAALVVGCWALLVGLARPAESSSITSQMQFETTGTIGSTGLTGAPALQFAGTSGGWLTTGSAFDLGSFVVAPIASGATTTYKQTPFSISFSPQSVDGSTVPEGPPIVLHGWINGTIGGGTSNASFVVDRLAYPLEETPKFPSYVTPFRAGKWLDSIFDAPGASTSLSSSGGSTPIRAVIQAELAPSPVPEPGTIGVIASGIGLFALRRLWSRRSGD